MGLRTLKSSHSHMFFRIGVLKNFAKFKGKQLSWSLFLIKLQASRLATLLKKELRLRCFPFKYYEIFRNSCFWTPSHINGEAFFARIIYYLSVNYFWEGSKQTSFLTAYVRKRWMFNQCRVLKVY